MTVTPDPISDLKVGDVVYIIDDILIHYLAIDAVTYTYNKITIKIDSYSFDIYREQFNDNYFSTSVCGFFINKEDAVKRYKQIMTETISKMENMLYMLNKI